VVPTQAQTTQNSRDAFIRGSLRLGRRDYLRSPDIQRKKVPSYINIIRDPGHTYPISNRGYNFSSALGHLSNTHFIAVIPFQHHPFFHSSNKTPFSSGREHHRGSQTHRGHRLHKHNRRNVYTYIRSTSLCPRELCPGYNPLNSHVGAYNEFTSPHNEPVTESTKLKDHGGDGQNIKLRIFLEAANHPRGTFFPLSNQWFLAHHTQMHDTYFSTKSGDSQLTNVVVKTTIPTLFPHPLNVPPRRSPHR